MAQIQITFNDVAADGNYVEFEYYYPNTGLGAVTRETWQTAARNGSGQIQVPTSGNTATQAAIAFAHLWDLDFNPSDQFIMNRVDNVVTITTGDNVPFWFRNPDVDPGAFATIVIDNGLATFPNLVSDTYSASASDQCTQFDLSVELSEVCEQIETETDGVGTILETGNTDNPKDFTLARGVRHRIKFTNSDGNFLFYPSVTQRIFVPQMFNQGVQVNVTPGLTGATVTVNILLAIPYTPNPELELEYSINNVDWQTDNTFSGQTNGSYTAYVRDQFGCVVSKAYEVTDSGTRDPFIFLSRSNFLSFAECVDTDGCSTHTNDDNSLAINSLVGSKAYTDFHVVQQCDTTKTQFKSNYDNISGVVRHEDGTEDALALVQQSSNLSRYYALDCKMYNYGNGLTGLYFTSGDTYDESLVDNGDFELNGNVPDFAEIGNIIEVVGVGTFFITDVTFDSNLQRKVILFENSYTGAVADQIVRSTYDLLDYEIWEFQIDWSGYDEGCYDVVITFEDTINDTVIIQSENIYVKETWEGTLKLIWYNNENNNQDIFYIYGLQHEGRFRYTEIRGLIDDEVEPNITDLSAYLSDSTLVDGNTIEFDAMPRNMALTLAIALSTEHLFINDIGYIKKESLKWEPIVGTNLVEVTAELIKTNINYNINRQGQVGAAIDSIEFNIPQLVGTDVGLIKS